MAALTKSELIRNMEADISNLDMEIAVDERNLSFKKGRRDGLVTSLNNLRDMGTE